MIEMKDKKVTKNFSITQLFWLKISRIDIVMCIKKRVKRDVSSRQTWRNCLTNLKELDLTWLNLERYIFLQKLLLIMWLNIIFYVDSQVVAKGNYDISVSYLFTCPQEKLCEVIWSK